MKSKYAISVLLFMLFMGCISCGGKGRSRGQGKSESYGKSEIQEKDLVGVWRVKKMSSYPEANFDVLAWVIVFGDNGTFNNVVTDLRKGIKEQDKNIDMIKLLLNGKWKLSGDSIKVRALSGHDDIIKIERLEDDELVIRHKTFDVTFTCYRFADDVDEASKRLIAQKYILDQSR